MPYQSSQLLPLCQCMSSLSAPTVYSPFGQLLGSLFCPMAPLQSIQVAQKGKAAYLRFPTFPNRAKNRALVPPGSPDGPSIKGIVADLPCASSTRRSATKPFLNMTAARRCLRLAACRGYKKVTLPQPPSVPFLFSQLPVSHCLLLLPHFLLSDLLQCLAIHTFPVSL